MGKKTNYKEGDLIRIIEHNGWTLGSLQLQQSGELVVRECPLDPSSTSQAFEIRIIISKERLD